MYDELVKKLRYCGNAISCLHCPYWEECGPKEDLTQAADAIEKLSKPKWIPVTETPKLKVGDEGYTGYLVYANGFYEIGDYTTDKFGNLEYFHVDGELETDVTHYMPLPGPPKEG